MKLLDKDKISEKKNKLAHLLPYSRTIGFLLIVVVCLFGIKLYFTNYLATSGVRLTAINQKIETLEDQREALQNEISKLGSMTRLQKEAKKLGFKAIEEVEVLSPPLPLAQRP